MKALIKHHGALINLKFKRKQLTDIAAHSGGSKALNILASNSNTKTLLDAGLLHEDITAIASCFEGGGADSLRLLAEQSDKIKNGVMPELPQGQRGSRVRKIPQINGFYVGTGIGGSQANFDTNQSFTFSPTIDGSTILNITAQNHSDLTDTSLLGNLNLGYGHVFTHNFFLGVEADANFQSLDT